MCLSTAYETANGIDKLICERVASIVVEGNNVRLTDIFGSQTVVPGAIKSVDLNKNVILIQHQ